MTTTNLPSVSVDLPSLDVTYNWNHTICGLLHLASLSSHVFEFHPRSSLYQNFIPSHG